MAYLNCRGLKPCPHSHRNTDKLQLSPKSATIVASVIGVNTGGTGGRVPPEFALGDANVIRPPDFGHLDVCSVRNLFAQHAVH